MERGEESSSMVSATIGRAMSTILSARSKKLLHSLSLLPSPNKPPLDSLQHSLWLLHNYATQTSHTTDNNLDQIFVPLLQHCLRSKESKGQVMIIVNWLFEDASLFEFAANSLASVITRKEDRYVALGWCLIVRGILEHESFGFNHCTLNGMRDNYIALLKILYSCIPRLLQIVCSGSIMQDGFELPSRLSMAAADCILSITEALTKKKKDLGDTTKAIVSGGMDRSIALIPVGIREKKVAQVPKSSEVPNIEMAYLLWDQIDELKTLLQRLLAWSRKSRPLHAKGVEQVLKWLQEVKGHNGCSQNEAGATGLKSRALLVSSCWKHYSFLLHLEDQKFSQRSNGLLDQYLSGIQVYADNHAEHKTNMDAGLETRKFFLNCLSLLLGRFDSKRFDGVVSENGMQMSRVLLSQLHCADEDVMSVAICIFKAAIFKQNDSSGNGGSNSRHMETVLPSLFQLLDERDCTARAIVQLIAEYCSMSSGSNCLNQVLKRLASRNVQQRRNAIDVISELISVSSNPGNKLDHLIWQDITNHLLDCLRDEEITICEQASNMLSMIEPSIALPGLVQCTYSSDERARSYAGSALIAMLKRHNQQPGVICMLLDCVSNLSQSLEESNTKQNMMEGSNMDADRILKLIPEWSTSVQDWGCLIEPLINKMFSEPANATIVRFLSCINEHLAEAADSVLYHVLKKMKEQKKLESKTNSNEEFLKMERILFDRLCPLLIIRLLPLRVFDNLSSSIMYDQLSNQSINHGGAFNIFNHECVAAFLLERAYGNSEFEDVRKLSSELCGRIHPEVLFPIVSSLMEHAVSCHNTLMIKACLFSVCTSLVVRGRDAISHPAIFQIRKTIESVLLWPSLDTNDDSKAQHGCIDCLALMICAELQTFGSFQCSSTKTIYTGNTTSGNTILTYVMNRLINDENEDSASALSSENHVVEVPLPQSFRLCMANILISACQKISDSGKKQFAKRALPQLIKSVEVIRHPEIRAACLQILFSAVYHLKSKILPYSSDLLRLSLQFLRNGSEKERMVAAKLMASLMASEDEILEVISEGLLEAKSILLSISLSDPSFEVRQVCQKLLACITSP